MTQFVCLWEISGFAWDDDGEEYNTSNFFDYTEHHSLEEAKTMQSSDHYNIYYGIEEAGFQPIFVSDILEYQENRLVAKYTLDGCNEWRRYPVMSHWQERWPEIMTYPPQRIEENNFN